MQITLEAPDTTQMMAIKAMSNFTDALLAMWAELESKGVVTESNAEMYLWVKEAAFSLDTIKKAAAEAALQVYAEVMTSETAVDILNRVKEMKPCQS